MNGFFPVMLGGALGAGARYGLTLALPAARFPWATLAANLLGALLIGWVLGRDLSDGARLFLAVGLLGGFTTFSTFSAETWRLLGEGRAVTALAYVVASVAGALAMTALGMRLA